jgi:Mor family transcriptional regulator
MPNGIIPDLTGLIKDTKEEMQAMVPQGDDIMTVLQKRYPELYAELQSLPPEEQQAVLERVMGGQAQSVPTEDMGDM